MHGSSLSDPGRRAEDLSHYNHRDATDVQSTRVSADDRFPRGCRPGGLHRLRPRPDPGAGPVPDRRGRRPGRPADRLPRGVRLGLSPGPRLRRPGRLEDPRRPRTLPPLLRELRGRPWPGLGRPRRLGPSDAGLPGHRGHRARRGHALLLGPVLRPRRHAHGQAPQADADGRRTADLGLRGRLDDARLRYPSGPAGRGDLLGELHAATPNAHVRPGGAALLRPTADGRETWPTTMRHIALEGRCFVLSCNQFTRRDDYPEDYPLPQGDGPEAVVSRGGAASSTRWAGCWPGRTTRARAS